MKEVMKAVAALMLMTAVVGCAKPDEPNNGGNNNDGTINGHAYVDLGLPSGTLWATCNVGATKPESYGDYFAWGETRTKSSYDWNTYKYSEGGYDKLTKYCSNPGLGYNGFSDDLIMLEPNDDAATVNWGNDWHTPTTDQCSELYDNTYVKDVTQNGVEGRLFTAKNGKSLFIPNAGYRMDDEINGIGDFGGTWLNLLETKYSSEAWYLYSSSDYYSMNTNLRYYGMTVRAVHSAK